MLEVRALLVLAAICLLCSFAVVSTAAVWLGTAANIKLCSAVTFLLASRGGLRRMALLTACTVYVWAAPIFQAFVASATVDTASQGGYRMAGRIRRTAKPERHWTAALHAARTSWTEACLHEVQCMVASHAAKSDVCSESEPELSSTNVFSAATLGTRPELADVGPTKRPSMQKDVSMAVSSMKLSDRETSCTAAAMDCFELALRPRYASEDNAAAQERPESSHAATSITLTDVVAAGWKDAVPPRTKLVEAANRDVEGRKEAHPDMQIEDGAEADCLEHGCQPKEGNSGCSEQTIDEKPDLMEAGQAFCHQPVCADRVATGIEEAADVAGGSTEIGPSIIARAVPGMPQSQPCWEDLFTDAMSSEALSAEAASSSSPAAVGSSLQFRIHSTAAGHLLPVAKLPWPVPFENKLHMGEHPGAVQRVQREDDLIPALHTARKTSVRKLSWLLNERCKAHRAIVPQPPVALAVTCASASSLRWSRSADGKYTGMACV